MTKKCSFKLYLFILIIIFSVHGCTTKIKTKGPLNSIESAIGFKYYLPKNILVVDVNKKTIITKYLSDCLKVEEKKRIEYDINPPQTDIIPDFNNIFTIEIKHGALSADTIAIKRTDKQLIKTVSIDSEGKTADVAVNTLKAVASIAGAAYGLNIKPSPAIPIEDKAISLYTAIPLKIGKPDDYCNWIDLLKNEGVKTPEELTKTQVLTIIKNVTARNLFLKIKTDQKLIADLEHDRNQLYQKLDITTSMEGAEVIRARIKDKDAHIATMAKDLERDKLALNSIVQKFDEALNLGKTEHIESIREIFEIDDLPTRESLMSNKIGNEISKRFGRLGFAISIDRLYSKSNEASTDKNIGKNQAAQLNNNRTSESNDESDNSYIHYRDPVPVILSVYNKKNDDTISEENANNPPSVGSITLDWQDYQRYALKLFFVESKPAKVPYRTSYFGQRKVVLMFSDTGILTDMDFTTTASANVLAEKASTGIEQSIASFSTSVGKIKEIESAKAAIIKTQLQSRVDTLTSQKAILDAEIALEGAYADVDLLKQQVHLQNQMNYYGKLLESISSGDKAAIAEATSELNRKMGELSVTSAYLDALSGISKTSIDNILQIQAIKEQIIGIQSQLKSTPNNELLQTQIETLQLQLTILQKLLEVQQSGTN